MKRKISLLTVLIGFAVLSVAVGFFNALYAGYQVQKAQVVKNSLESNKAYAEKLAEFINLYIDALHRQLKDSAHHIAASADASTELARVAAQAQGVSAVLLADADGTITARTGPALAPLASVHTLNALGMNESRAANWLAPCCQKNSQQTALTLVEPIPGPGGTPAGFVAGVVILERGSRVDKVIGEHAYANGTTVYLVNVDGNVLYLHGASGPDEGVLNLIKMDVSPTSGPGSAQVQDASGDLLTGYAPITKGKWAVIIQRPLDQALSPLKTLLAESLRLAVPAVILTLLLVCGLAYAIAWPLAKLTRAMASPESIDRQGPQASLPKTWYLEADRLRHALVSTLAQHQNEVGRLNTQTMTDPMTGLLNRRALDLRFEELVAANAPFAVIALDLDHFKRVNDVFGHPVGDKVLIALAKILSDSVRQQDKPFRVGGEEFIVVVSASSPDDAMRAAERLRASVAQHEMPDGVGHATVSVGVALWPQHGKSAKVVVKCADQALYASKEAGRNRATLWAKRFR